ncbi:MAG: type VI secretion system protein TssA [Candidatus Thiodiazotropha sp.]
MDCINLEQLLRANSEVAPSGEDLEYDPLFGEMERAAKGKEEQQLGDTIISSEDPDWSALKSHALAILDRSKDLRAAVQLTRALIRTDGYAGLACGLSLIRSYIDEFWDTLHPQLDAADNNDPTLRINTLLNLCDPQDMLLPISRLPLITSHRLGAYSHREIQIATGELGTSENNSDRYSAEHMEAAFCDIDSKQLIATHQSVTRCIAEIEGISSGVSTRLADDSAFDLDPLHRQLVNARLLLADRSPESSSANTGTSGVPGADTATANTSVTALPTGPINDREDVINSLDRICRYYARYEPSSPVPLLLERAKRLVSMGFHEIVLELAPDGQSHFDFLWRQSDG